MTAELTAYFSNAMEHSLAAVFAWGVLSLVLSPCHLGSIPVIVAFIGGQGKDIKTSRAFLLASCYALGMLVTLAAVGAITIAAGRVAGDIGPWGAYVIAAALLYAGLTMCNILPMPGWAVSPKSSLKGPLGAFLIGLLYGIALGPCSFAFMAPVLSMAFAGSDKIPFAGALLVVSYSLGHCLAIAIAGTASGAIQRYLDWNDSKTTLQNSMW